MLVLHGHNGGPGTRKEMASGHPPGHLGPGQGPQSARVCDYPWGLWSLRPLWALSVTVEGFSFYLLNWYLELIKDRICSGNGEGGNELLSAAK